MKPVLLSMAALLLGLLGLDAIDLPPATGQVDAEAARLAGCGSGITSHFLDPP